MVDVRLQFNALSMLLSDLMLHLIDRLDLFLEVRVLPAPNPLELA